MGVQKQILPLNRIARFTGPITRSNDRRRVELNAGLKTIFQELDTDCYYVLEISFNKEILAERMRELIEEEKIMPSLIWFCKGE